MQEIKIGDTLTCHMTGKTFVAESQGCTVNYARSNDGKIFSDEGVDLFEKELLKKREPVFGCYLSSDGRKVTGWKGNVHGTVIRSNEFRGGWHGSTLTAVRVRDVYGKLWYGRGAGNSMYIRLRPMKGTS
jgi:hypothetical protein